MRYRLSCMLVCLIASSVWAQGKSSETVYDKVLRSTVFVIAPLQDNSNRATTGSGSYIGTHPRTNNPVIITNYHVVSPCVKENGNHGELRIMFPVRNSKGEIEQNRSKYMQSSGDTSFTYRGKILVFLKNKDLALVELIESQRGQQLPKGVTTLPLAANSPRPSSRVHTLGNPGVGGMWSYTEGSVRSVYEKKFSVQLSSSETLTIDARMIESSNPTNKGDSGGPLVNDDAELVGVTQGGVTNANQLSTFVDIQEVKTLLKQAKINIPAKRATTASVDKSTEKDDKMETKKDVVSNTPPSKDSKGKEADKPSTDPRESAAESKLRNARRAFKVKEYDLAENFLNQIIVDYAETKAVVEAKSLLDEIKKSKK